jgi:hypothetical protein
MPDPQPPATHESPSRRRNWIAIASVACGLPLCIPFIGIVAILLGVFGFRRTKNPLVRGKVISCAGILLGIVNLVISPSMLVAEDSSTAAMLWSSNFPKQIGLGLTLYANDHQGHYPPDLGALVKTEQFPVDNFLRPQHVLFPFGFRHPPANVAQMSPDGQAKWVDENADYLYLGANMTSNTDADQIVAYEKEQYVFSRQTECSLRRRTRGRR